MHPDRQAALRRKHLSTAQRLHVHAWRLLRRNLDVDWLVQDMRYLREIQRLCLEQGSAEMIEWARRLEEMADEMGRSGENTRPSDLVDLVIDDRVDVDLTDHSIGRPAQPPDHDGST